MIYGSAETRSGGYFYDRKVVEFLRSSGHLVEIVSIDPPSLVGAFCRGLFSRAAVCPAAPVLVDSAEFDWIVIDELVHPACFAWIRHRSPARTAVLVHHLAVSEKLRPTARVLHRRMERRLLWSADLVIANSENSAAAVSGLLGRRSHRPIPPISVCRPGVDRPPFDAGSGHEPSAEAADSATLPGSTPFTLIATGNLIRRKGHHLLLELIARVEPRVKLVVTGDREVDPLYTARLLRELRRRRLEDRITFVGYLSVAELHQAYRRANLFVTATEHEGYGMSLAEALCEGLPFVAFDAGALREVAPSAFMPRTEKELESLCTTRAATERGFSGILLPYADLRLFARAVSLIAADPSLLQAMSRNALADATMLPSWNDTGTCFASALMSPQGELHVG